MSELLDLSLAELSAQIRGRQVSPVEATRACLERIQERDRELNSFLTVCAEEAMADARRLEEIERQAIFEALRKHELNRTETAKSLGISRRALIYKLQRLRELGYEIDPLSDRSESAEV